MEITKLETQKKNPDRVSIFADGEFFLGINRLVALKMGLKKGLIITPKMLDQLKNTQTTHSAWEYALKLLEYGPKSKQMLFQKLKIKFDSKTATEITNQMQDRGLLNDEKVATAFVDYHMRQATKSRLQIIAALKSKRLSESNIRQAIAEVDDDYEKMVAKKISYKKLAKYRALEPQVIKQKLASYLSQRGFKYRIIKQIVDEVLTN